MSERLDAVLACVIAVAATIASLAWLRIASPPVTSLADAQSDALQIVWLEKPPAPVVVHEPVRIKRTSTTDAAPRKATRASAPIAPVPSPPPRTHLHMPEFATPSFARDPFQRPQRDIATPNRLPGIVLQDSSLMGRIAAMSTISACGELRALLRRGGVDAPNPEVILRSMQARGCVP